MRGMDELTSSIERALCEVHQLERTVQNYKESSQMLVFERLNDLVKELAAIQSAANKCQVQIPVEVVRYVDEGRNPDEFTREFLNACLERNEATKGRVEVFKSLRRHLLDEMDEAFPEETEAYRALRTASLQATESSMKAQAGLTHQANGATEEAKHVKQEPVDESGDVEMS